MTVYKPPGRSYYIYDFVIDGKRHKASTKRSSRADALKIEAKKRQEILNGEQLGHLPTLLFFDAIVQWFADYGSRLDDAPRLQNHIEIMMGEAPGYLNHIRGLPAPDASRERQYDRKRKWLWPNKHLHLLTEGDLRQFVNARFREEVSASIIHAELSVVRRTVNKLRGEYKTPTIEWPSSREDRRLKPNAKSRFLTEEEIGLLMEAMDPVNLLAPSRWHEILQQDCYDVAMFLLNTGCRPDEGLSMLWSDIRLHDRRILLDRPKVSQWTGLVMSNSLFKILERRSRETNSPYVFPDRENGGPRKSCRAIGKTMDRVGLNEPWKVERYGGRATAYTLRDTFASRLAQSGKHTLLSISKLLGHTDVKQTQKYAHLVPDTESEAAAMTLDELNANL